MSRTSPLRLVVVVVGLTTINAACSDEPDSPCPVSIDDAAGTTIDTASYDIVDAPTDTGLSDKPCSTCDAAVPTTLDATPCPTCSPDSIEPNGQFNVLSYGAAGDGQTDDTDAIQSAIDAAAAAGGGRVYFPRGKYRLSKTFRDPKGANAQLVLPSVFTYTDQPLPIVLEGPFPPATNYSLYSPQAATENAAVLVSDANGGGAVIGAYGPPGSFEHFSNIAAVVKNLIIRTYGNPDVTGLDLGLAFSAEVEDVIVDVGITVMNDIPAPTHSVYGMIAPLVNNGALASFRKVQVVGYPVGLRFSEHFDGDLIQLWGCRVGMEAGPANHASYMARAMVVWSSQCLRAASGPHPMVIEQLAIEHRNPTRLPAGFWENPIPNKDIEDPNNYLHGRIEWYAVLADVGEDPSLGVTGAANLALHRLGDL